MSRRTNKFYSYNEDQVMSDLGLDRVFASGAGWMDKEDGQNEHVIAQLKSTDAGSMKVSKLDIDKLEYNADIAHKIPVFVINFLKSEDVYLVLKPEYLQDLAEYLSTGSVDVKEKAVLLKQTQITQRKRIGSGNKNKYHDEQEKLREERQQAYKEHIKNQKQKRK